MPEIITFQEADPRHVRTAYLDSMAGGPQYMTVYTGQITVDHGAGGQITGLQVRYPVLGLFRKGNLHVKGIVPLEDPRIDDQFVGAVATTAFPDILSFKDDYGQQRIENVRADLRRLKLGQGLSQPIFAVVLSFETTAYEAHIRSVSYQVTVLSKFRRRNLSPLRFDAPVVVGNLWDGTYGEIGPVVRRGAPNEKV